MTINPRYADGDYLSKHPGWHEERSAWKAGHVIRGLLSAEIRPRTICDIGCGTGAALAAVAGAMDDVERAVGFEPSPDAPFNPDAQRHVELRREDATMSGEHFDVSLMLDVFEHVEDYFSFLRNCRPLADVHVFHVPLDANAATVVRNGFMKARNSVGHLHYFSRLTALATLRDTGYEPIHWHFTKSSWEGPDRKPWSPASLCRRILFRISPECTHRLLGGVALLVVARSSPETK